MVQVRGEEGPSSPTIFTFVPLGRDCDGDKVLSWTEQAEKQTKGNLEMGRRKQAV